MIEQWREDVESEQDHESCVIPFADIVEVAMLEEPMSSFQIVTSGPRSVVFQCRPQQEEETRGDGDEERELTSSGSVSMDAEQWCEYLGVFSQCARQQQQQQQQTSNQHHSPTYKDIEFAFGEVKDEIRDVAATATKAPAFDERVFARITRAIIHEDGTALEEMFAAEPGHTQHMVDESGSSLLIVALKLGAGPRIIRILLDADVDCNAKNDECVGV